MAVIKAQHGAALLKEAIVLDLGDLGRQGERLRKASEAKAQRIVAEGQAEAKRLIDAAHAEGFDAGHAKGLTQGIEEGRQLGRGEALAEMKARLEALDEAWSENLAQWDQQRQLMERQSKEAILKLSLALADCVVHRVIEVDPAVISDQLAQAAAQILRPGDLTVRINPADHAVVEDALPRLKRQWVSFTHITLLDDPQIEPGGCVLTCGQGTIDASIQTQLRRIAQLMLPADQQTAPPLPEAPTPDRAESGNDQVADSETT